MKVVRNLFQMMERYDGHGGDVKGLKEMHHLTGSVTVIREV